MITCHSSLPTTTFRPRPFPSQSTAPRWPQLPRTTTLNAEMTRRRKTAGAKVCPPFLFLLFVLTRRGRQTGRVQHPTLLFGMNGEAETGTAGAQARVRPLFFFLLFFY